MYVGLMYTLTQKCMPSAMVLHNWYVKHKVVPSDIAKGGSQQACAHPILSAYST